MSEPTPDVKSVFGKALERPLAPERAAYLDVACAARPALRAEVDALLRAHERAGEFLNDDDPAVTAAFSAAGATVSAPGGDPAPTADLLPTKNLPRAVERPGALVAGRYKLLQQIGEGGMGAVWMADQTEPIKRRVAVKLIRADRGSSRTILTRFEAERQAIALMNHPHIAKLLDAGTTDDGQPFFVMELVKGMPLTEYCDAHRLSLPDRLNLFRQICSAVHHAHQKGIIHRDLKPTNILVESHDGKPVPKVIDFGLAKATTGMQLTEHTLYTGYGSVMGTPAYMAPEQATFNAVDVDTRADVYALGVILYELLTGTTPLTRDTIRKAALDEMLRLIREQDAPPPSSRLSPSGSKPSVAANRQTEPARLGRFVKGELDWIVLMALAKERERRYATADGFARDVERFLNHEPVQAGPPTARYRLRKFARRNRVPVLVTGLLLAALLAGATGTTWGLFRAERSRDEAETALKRVGDEQTNTREALAQATAAESANRRIVARQYVSRGGDLLEQGNRTDALAWFVAALKADAPEPDRERAHRTRIATTARMCPRPDHLWFDPAGQPLQSGFSPDGKAVFAVTAEGAEVVVRVWDRATGAERFPALRLPETWQTDLPRSASGSRLAYSPDGGRFWTLRHTDFGPVPGAVGNIPKGVEIRVWDAATGRLLSTLPPGCAAPTFTPDGTRLLTVRGAGAGPDGAAGGEAVVWDVGRSAEAYPPLRIEGGVESAHLAAAATRIVASGTTQSGSERFKFRIWKVADGTPVTDELPGFVLSSHAPDSGDRVLVRSIPKPAGDSDGRPELQTIDIATGRPLGPPRDVGRMLSLPSQKMIGAGGKRFLAMEMRKDGASDGIILGNTTLFDTVTWQVIRDGFPGSNGFSPDGRRFLTTTSATAVVRDAETGLAIGAEIPLRDGSNTILFSPDSRRVLVIEQELGQIWDAELGAPIARDIRFDTADQRPAGAFAADSRHVAVWTGNQARVWGATTGKPVTPLLVHPAAVVSAEFSPDGFHLLTGCADGTIRLWPVTAGEPPARHLDHHPNPLAGFFSFRSDGSGPAARLTFTQGEERDLPGGVLLGDGEKSIRLPTDWTSGGRYPYALDPGWGRIVCWNNDAPPTGRVYDVTTGQRVGSELRSDDPVEATGFSPDGMSLWAVSAPRVAKPGVAADLRRQLHLWDEATGRPRTPLPGPLPGQTPKVSFACGGTIIVVSTDQAVSAWETATGRRVAGAFPDGAKLADGPAGGHGLVVQLPDGRTLLWDTGTGRAIGPALQLQGEVVWDPKAGLLWTLESTGQDGGRATRSRDVLTGEPTGPPTVLPNGSAAWPIPGQYSDRGLHETTVNLLDPANGRPTGVTLRHADPIESLWFSDDGRMAITTAKSGGAGGMYRILVNNYVSGFDTYRVDARVWDVATGELLGPSLRHLRGFGNRPRFAPADARVLTCPTPDEVLLVDFAPDPRPAEALARIADGLSGRRLTGAGQFVPIERTAHRAAWGELPSLLPPAPDAEYRPAGWHRGQARTARRANDLSAARFHLDRLVALAPADATAHRDLAEVAIDQRDTAAAIKAADRATALEPANATWWLLRGKIERDAGRWQAAGDYYRRAIEVVRPDGELEEQDAWRYYLFCRALSGNPDGYREACASLIAKYADRGAPRLILRWTTLRTGGVEDIRGLIRKAEEAAAKEPESAQFDLSVLAQAYMRLGDDTAAMGAADALEKRFPAGFAGYDRLVRAVALARLGRVGEAQADLHRAKLWGQKFVYGTGLAAETGRPIQFGLKLTYIALLPEAEGLVLKSGTGPRAVDYARQCVAAWEKLIVAEPNEPDHRAQLAESLEALGGRLRDRGDKADGEGEHRKALAVRQKLAADFPADPARQTDVGWAFVRFGARARGDRSPAAALDWYTEAIAAAGLAFQKNPPFDGARQCLRQAHWGFGDVLNEAGKHAEAVRQFERALELSTGADRIDPLSFLALSRVRAGEVAEALRDADKLAKEDGAAASYNAACVYAVASGQSKDQKTAYGDRAMELLLRAVRTGFKDITLLKTDTDLAQLRHRSDFQTLLTELERKFPPPREVAPPPRERK